MSFFGINLFRAPRATHTLPASPMLTSKNRKNIGIRPINTAPEVPSANLQTKKIHLSPQLTRQSPYSSLGYDDSKNLQANVNKTRIENLQEQIQKIKDLQNAYGNKTPYRTGQTSLIFLNRRLAELQQGLRQSTEKQGLALLPQLPEIPFAPFNFEDLDLDTSKPLTAKELRTLADLSTFLQAIEQEKEPQLKKAQKQRMAELFLQSIGNKAKSSQMDELIKQENAKHQGINPGVALLVRDFALNTIEAKKAISIAKKAKTLIHRLHKDQEIPEKDKLTLSEIASLMTLSKNGNAIDLIKFLGLKKVNSELATFVRNYQNASLIYNQLEYILRKHSNYKNGDILLSENNESGRQSFILSQEKDKEGKIISEKILASGDKAEHLLLKDRANLSAYSLNPASLLNDSLRGTLDDMYEAESKELSTELRSHYQASLNEIIKTQDSKELLDFVETHIPLSQTAALFRTIQNDESKPMLKMLLTVFLNQEKKFYQELSKSSIETESLLYAEPIFNYTNEKEPLETLYQLDEKAFLQHLANKNCLHQIQLASPLQKLVKLDINQESHIVATPLNEPKEQALQFLLLDPKPLDKRDKQLEPDCSLFDKWCNVGVNPQFLPGIIALGTDVHAVIKGSRQQILQQKEYWREHMPHSAMRYEVLKLLQNEFPHPIDAGMGGAYLLMDGKEPEFVLKANDEDLMTLNNRKRVASPYDGSCILHRVKYSNPLYQAVQNEVLVYETAKILGLEHTTPETAMVIVKSDAFYDVLDGVKNRDELLRECGEPDREKLCSAQRYVKNSLDYQDYRDNLSTKAKNEELTKEQVNKILERSIIGQSVEDVLLLICITGEPDGNRGNFRLVESIDKKGKKRYTLVKIDNGLGFPDSNREFANDLWKLPQINRLLSNKGKHTLLHLDVSGIESLMRNMGKSEKSIQAFRDRIDCLQKLARRQGVTLKEINQAIENLKNVFSKKEVVKNESLRKLISKKEHLIDGKKESLEFNGTMEFKSTAIEGDETEKPHTSMDSMTIKKSMDSQTNSMIVIA